LLLRLAVDGLDDTLSFGRRDRLPGHQRWRQRFHLRAGGDQRDTRQGYRGAQRQIAMNLSPHVFPSLF